jgi:hypothetical protein
MKGFFFGGKVDKMDEMFAVYNEIIIKSLEEKYLGADETYFTILVNQRPELFDQVIVPNCINTMLSF